MLESHGWKKLIRNIVITFSLLILFTPLSYAADLDNDRDTDQVVVKDPLEKMNRIFFDFNERVDITIAKPIATVYNIIMPPILAKAVHNFYNNILNVPIIVNDILQLNFYQMASDSWRLAINSTVGLAGFIDVATHLNLPQHSNDFGLTLARWGLTNSTYVVIPFWGPNTIRDGIGLPVDYFLFSVYPHVYPLTARYWLYSVMVLDKRAQLLKVQKLLDEASFDRYVFVRNAYLQHRAYQIEDIKHRTYEDLKPLDKPNR